MEKISKCGVSKEAQSIQQFQFHDIKCTILQSVNQSIKYRRQKRRKSKRESGRLTVGVRNKKRVSKVLPEQTSSRNEHGAPGEKLRSK